MRNELLKSSGYSRRGTFLTQMLFRGTRITVQKVLNDFVQTYETEGHISCLYILFSRSQTGKSFKIVEQFLKMFSEGLTDNLELGLLLLNSVSVQGLIIFSVNSQAPNELKNDACQVSFIYLFSHQFLKNTKFTSFIILDTAYFIFNLSTFLIFKGHVAFYAVVCR